MNIGEQITALHSRCQDSYLPHNAKCTPHMSVVPKSTQKFNTKISSEAQGKLLSTVIPSSKITKQFAYFKNTKARQA
jgi:hypothetical protein